MKSIDGIYLANSLVEIRKGNDVTQDIRTVITYDNGFSWHYLDPPRLDYEVQLNLLNIVEKRKKLVYIPVQIYKSTSLYL